MRAIGTKLCRVPNTLSRELRRHNQRRSLLRCRPSRRKGSHGSNPLLSTM
ncbi:hypothetical protein [Nitrosococcus oceani]